MSSTCRDHRLECLCLHAMLSTLTIFTVLVVHLSDPPLRAGFHCGFAAPLLVIRGLKRHHYHSDRGSSWSSEAAAHRELSLRFLIKNCEPRSRLDLFPVLCIVLYARIFKIQILIRCAGQNTSIFFNFARVRAHARAGR